MRYVGLVVCMRMITNECNILAGKLYKRRHLGNLSVNGTIILK